MNDTAQVTNCRNCGVFIYSDENITVCWECLANDLDDHNGG